MRSIIVAILIASAGAFAPAPHISKGIYKRSSTSFPNVNFELQVASTRSNDKKRYAPERREAILEEGSSKNPLANFSESYQQLQKDYYLQMAFLQAGVLASCADIATQTMEATSIDFGHVAAMATVASTMSGAANAIWLKQLENTFPGTETKEVFLKTMIHATIIASIINSAYLAFVPLLTAYLYHDGGAVDFSIIFSGWSMDEFITLTKLEILMFIPYNTLAFKYVPPSVRPLTHAAISAAFNVAVSAVTLGYFNKWCENAAHIFS